MRQFFIFLLFLLFSHFTMSGNVQKTIDQAEKGETIKLIAGINTGNLNITKPVILKSDGNAIIEGAGLTPVIVIDSNDVTLDGFTIKLTGKNEYGILIKKAKNIKIINCKIIGDSSLKIADRGNGIQIVNGKDIFIRNVLFENLKDGVYSDHSSEITIEKSTVTLSRYGYHLMFSGNVTLKENKTVKSVIGTMIMNSADVKVTSNLFENQRGIHGCGIFSFDSKNSIIENNKIINNTTGFSLDKSKNILIKNNLIAENARGIDKTGNIDETYFSGNSFTGNVINISGSADWSEDNFNIGGIGNFWDDYKGFDLDGNGIGDGAYRQNDSIAKLFEKNKNLGIFFSSTVYTLLENIGIFDKKYDLYPLIKRKEL